MSGAPAADRRGRSARVPTGHRPDADSRVHHADGGDGSAPHAPAQPRRGRDRSASAAVGTRARARGRRPAAGRTWCRVIPGSTCCPACHRASRLENSPHGFARCVRAWHHEPPRDCRRLPLVSGWAPDEPDAGCFCSAGAGSAAGAGASLGIRHAVGGHHLDCQQDRVFGGDPAEVGAAHGAGDGAASRGDDRRAGSGQGAGP